MINVAIAEAHEVTRAGIRSLLKGEHDIRITGESSDGPGTLALVQSVPADVLTLGLGMRGLHGSELIAQIRCQRPAPRIVVVTRLSNESDATRCFRAGASGFVIKSSPACELLVAIRRVAAGGVYVNLTMADDPARCIDADVARLPHQRLTNAEFQVLVRIAGGQSTTEIATTLGIDRRTVGTHRTHILQKMDLSSDAELMRYAIDHKLVSEDGA